MNDMIPLENITSLIYQLRGTKGYPGSGSGRIIQCGNQSSQTGSQKKYSEISRGFMFELTLEEDRRLRSRNVTLKKVNIQNMVQWSSQNKVTMPEFKG